MKNKIGLLCLLLVTTFCMAGCNGKNGDVEVTFDAYQDYSGAVLQISYAGEKEEVSSASYTTKKGETIKKVLEPYEVESIEPVCEYDEFEGWMCYEVISHLEESGEENLEYVNCDENTLYSWEEVQEIKIEKKDVLFVAKWKSIPIGAYFTDTAMAAEELAADGSMTLYANGGVLLFDEAETFETDVYTYWMEDGKSVQAAMESEWGELLTEVSKETETFAGWNVYVGDSAEWTDTKVENGESQCFELGDNVFLILENAVLYQEGMSTEDLKKIICDGKCYYAVANWK